jgi:hypothetical protein
VESTLVQALPLADRKQLERVVVVRDHGELGVDRLPVDGQPDAVAIAGQQEERAKLGERVPAPAMTLPLVDEVRVEAERDVVQEEPLADSPDVDPLLRAGERVESAKRVVPVEAQIAREVVSRPERNADERKVAFERDLGDRGERAVAAGDTERVGLAGGSGQGGWIILGSEDPGVDPAARSFVAKLLRARAAAPRAGIDEEKTYALTGSSSSERSSADFGWAPIAAAAGSPSLNRTIAGIEAIP